MPELPEIHNFARLVQKKGSEHVFTSIVQREGNERKWPALDPHRSFSAEGFKLTAEPRGKELQITLTTQRSRLVKTFVFNLGLEGKWVWYEESQPKKPLLQFASLGGGLLCLVDSMSMATWHEGTFDTVKRGPDPVLDPEGFVSRIKAGLTGRDFKKNIGEMLLDQKYFNGIGNYLRAEILARACVSPYESAQQVLSQYVFFSAAEKVATPKGDLICALCYAIPKEVVDLGLNKYGSFEEKTKFQEWLTCYGKAKNDKDKGGRTIWYFPDQASRQPSSKDLQYAKNFDSLPRKGTSGPATSTGPWQEATVASTPQHHHSVVTSIQSASTSAFFFSSASAARPASVPQTLSFPTMINSSPATTNVSDSAKLLLLIGVLFKASRIDSEEKSLLKEIVIGRQPKWRAKLDACLEYFECENDLDEVGETMRILSRNYYHQQPADSVRPTLEATLVA